MLTLIWLLVWVLNDTPKLSYDPLNTWFVTVIICLVLDIFGGFRLRIGRP